MMIPSLFTFTLLAALVLVLVGIPMLSIPGKAEPLLRAFPRHRMTALVTMLLGGGWFLWKISQLGQSDFGDYKLLLMILFGATLIGSLVYVKDFLAVRGVAILVLLTANTGLKAAFGHYEIPERLILVSFLYIFIIAALFYGVAPYHMRDTVNWLCRSLTRIRVLGLVFSLMGAALCLSAIAY